jgi:hypothetical protein
MTGLPGSTVLAGGSYRTPAGPVHSCLLISRDGGRTWADLPFRFSGATIGRLESFGASTVWALVLFNAEGAQSPEHLLVSRDGAVTWETIDWTWGPPGPLVEVNDLRLLDETHGTAWLQNSLGHGQLLQTSDAGRSWRPIWDTQAANDLVDWPMTYPREEEPLHASVLTPQSGFTTPAQGLLRVLEGPREEDPFLVERIVYWQGRAPRDAAWEKWGEIPRAYVVEHGTLTPKRRS